MMKFTILIGLTANNGGLYYKPKQVIKFIAERLNAFSVVKQTGYWDGFREKSLAITVIGTESEYAIKLEKLCCHLRDSFMQDSVYLTRENIELTDINAEFVPRETYNSKLKQ